MSMKAASTHRDIDQEARDWFFRLLAEDVTTDELVDWNAWLDTDLSHRQAYDRVLSTWSLAERCHIASPTPAELAADSYYGAMPVSIWRKAGRPWRLAAGLAAAGLAAVVVFSGLMIDRLGAAPGPAQELITGRAQHMNARLADGSRIYIGAMSKVDVELNRRERNLGLSRGEALFQVAHDSARPFRVKTPLAHIVAVGTAFDVNVQSNALILKVSDGIVSVQIPELSGGRPAEAEEFLRVKAGQAITLRREQGRMIVESKLEDRSRVWSDDSLDYRSERLSNVLEDVNRYSARPITLQDASLSALTFTGTVSTKRIDAWVASLPGIFPVEIVASPQAIILKKTGAGR